MRPYMIKHESIPFTTADCYKLIGFCLSFIPLCLFWGAGIPPVILFITGIIISRYKQDISGLTIANRIWKIYLIIVIAIVASFLIDEGRNWYRSGNEIWFGVPIDVLVGCFYLWLADKCFFEPLQRHTAWLESKSLLPRAKDKSGKMLEGTILTKSAADELFKWAKLRDAKIITEEDFNKIRSDLLRKSKG